MNVYVNEHYGTQVVIDNGKIVNVPITGFPCHFWDNEENLEIEYTDTGIIVCDSCETSVNQVIFDNFVPLVIDAKYFEECTGMHQ